MAPRKKPPARIRVLFEELVMKDLQIRIKVMKQRDLAKEIVADCFRRASPSQSSTTRGLMRRLQIRIPVSNLCRMVMTYLYPAEFDYPRFESGLLKISLLLSRLPHNYPAALTLALQRSKCQRRNKHCKQCRLSIWTHQWDLYPANICARHHCWTGRTCLCEKGTAITFREYLAADPSSSPQQLTERVMKVLEDM